MPADDASPPAIVAGRLRGSLAAARVHKWPFAYWLFEDALPPSTLAAMAELPFAPSSGLRLDGRRESNNSTRLYLNPRVQGCFAVCREIAMAFGAPETVDLLGALIGRDLSGGQLRIEYCQDTDGFWLEPHVDVPVKLVTILIYLSDEPGQADAGTDIYDSSPDHRLVARAPFGPGKGLIFAPGRDTWHGFTPRPISGVRRSLIVNFVGPDWRSVEELA